MGTVCEVEFINTTSMRKYSKIEVAVELLIDAKKLLENGRYVSATVLAGAAQQIVRDICRKKQIDPAIKTLAKNEILDRTELHDFISCTYNKLKHANKEQFDVVVSEDETRVLMGLAATDLMRLNVNPNKSIVDILNFVKQKLNVVS